MHYMILVRHDRLQFSHLARPQARQDQVYDLEVAEQRRLAIVVVRARAHCEAFAPRTRRLLVLRDALEIEDDTSWTLSSTLSKHCIT